MDRYPQIKTFWEFLDTTPKLSQYEQGTLFKHNVGEVKLQQICFGYEEGKNLITNFSLTIQGGTKVAFVGHSGSGKTTIVKLIAGYLQPKQGQVLVDGQDISEVSLASYYKDIGYLTQDPMVFDGTIKENMQYATAETLSDEQMWKALDLAECGFVRDMKDGLNSAIGEKGVRLSGGERQRLAIAKLFIKNPKIIILDEPTSALDSFAEDNITKALHKLFKDRTVIIIAHRLQTVQEADVIYVMEKGHIIEQGTHKGLIKQKGLYADMLKLQSGF